MCGIFGAVNFSERAITRESLERMSAVLAPRGPDREGFYFNSEGNIGLGNRRLSIVDISSGNQPISNEDETIWISFNGEIYNHTRLRNELKNRGHKFSTESDTEVIVHLYEELGTDCLDKLDGMFSFAIWDERRGELFLARDALGQKPLHYVRAPNFLAFSSEIKALLAYSGFDKGIDRRSLAKYFMYGYVPAPNTMFQGIKKLLPGHFMVVTNNGEVKNEKYWDFDYSEKSENSEGAIKDHVITLLDEAVKKRIPPDPPWAVFLSGGVDSSLVTALMTKYVDPSKIKAFSLGFSDDTADESIYSRMVADHLGVEHYLKVFSQKDEILEMISRVGNFLDEPMADPSILPTFFVSYLAQEHGKVVLSGDGGDENFAGYPKYLAHWVLETTKLGILPLSLLSRFFSGRIGSFFRYASYPLSLRNQLWISPFSPQEVKELTGDEVSFEDPKRYHKEFNGNNKLDEVSFLDQKLTLADLYLVKTDRAAGAASLEVRSPFLDKELVEFCVKIPAGLKLKRGRTKAMLKDIALDYLPEEAVLRPKRGFGIPLSQWLNNELQPMVREYLSKSNIESAGILNPQAVQNILEQNNTHQIWGLLIFEMWRRRWYEK